jgi:hypothetical protein
VAPQGSLCNGFSMAPQLTDPATLAAVGTAVGESPAEPLSLRELGELLVRHYEISEGIYELTVEFQLGVGALGPSPTELLPSAIASVSRIGLRRVPEGKPGPGLIDASALRTGTLTPTAERLPAGKSGKATKAPAKKASRK